MSKNPTSTPRQSQFVGRTHAYEPVLESVPGPGPGPIAVPSRKAPAPAPAPILSETERRAYQVAHKLLSKFHIAPVGSGDVAVGRDGKELAAPGARRSRLVDLVAGVVKEEMER
jgi:hypothetical protein